MLGDKRVLIVLGDAASGQPLVEAIGLVQGRVVGPVMSATEAMPLLASARPDVVVLDFGSAGPGRMALLDRLLANGTPVVVCAEPGLLPEFRGNHPTLSVLPTPVRPMRVIGELAVLLRL